MTVLIIGGSGQLGTALQQEVPKDCAYVAPGREVLDLARPESLTETLDQIAPSAIINAAAFTDVDRAESESELADRINNRAPGLLATWCAANGAKFLHISTDFVFSGARSEVPIQPDSPAAPVNMYGRTKVEGEDAVRAADGNAIILRTSWLYGPRFGTGFVDRMLTLARTRETLSAVTDQIGSPTSAISLARMVWQIVATDLGYGETHHAVCRGAASRFDLVGAAIDEARALGADLACKELLPALTDAFPSPAPRPAYSVLDPQSLEARFGIDPPDWRQALQDHIRTVLPALKATGAGS